MLGLCRGFLSRRPAGRQAGSFEMTNILGEEWWSFGVMGLYRGFLSPSADRRNDNFILLVGRVEMTTLLMGFLPANGASTPFGRRIESRV